MAVLDYFELRAKPHDFWYFPTTTKNCEITRTPTAESQKNNLKNLNFLCIGSRSEPRLLDVIQTRETAWIMIQSARLRLATQETAKAAIFVISEQRLAETFPSLGILGECYQFYTKKKPTAVRQRSIERGEWTLGSLRSTRFWNEYSRRFFSVENLTSSTAHNNIMSRGFLHSAEKIE